MKAPSRRMARPGRDWFPASDLLIFLFLPLSASFLAWRQGGGADARRPPPHAPTAAAAADDDGAPARGAEAYQTKVRLVDLLGDARIDVPNLAAAQPLFDAHWRKLRGPWVRLPGLAGQLATTIAFRTSVSETQWSVLTPSGRNWIPEARVWNMNEGSFDQREAIYAPTPSTIAVRVTIPHAARFRASPAVMLPLQVATVFDATLVDAAGASYPLVHVRAQEPRRWIDADVDLATWGGQQVEIRLRAATDSAGGDVASPALWGNPVIVAKEPTRVPYSVLWIVVDALRPDVAASFHDDREDAEKRAAPRPPLDALLPKMPRVLPSIDRLASRGARFVHAWSAGAWTRPGTLAMLAGERSGELGIDTLSWTVPVEQATSFYASNPPLLPLVLRKSGVATAAFVNNFFMAGYAAVGVDMGFERVVDHRYRTRDTAEITRDARSFIDAHADDRFFLFVNYNSPHEPYDATRAMLARVPPPPDGPRHPQVRQYVAEATKDDAAIGELLDAIEARGLTKSTLVVVTSDHGETLSAAHAGFGLEHMPVRFHHAASIFEETTRIPIVMALPGVIDGGRAVEDRVRSTDIAPTILEVEQLEADPRMSGRSMMPLVRGQKDADGPRVVVSEGRGQRAILWDRWRLVTHDVPPGPDDLFDLAADPGEQQSVAAKHPDVVAEMRARLTAALANVRAADTPQPVAGEVAPTLRVRFAGAGRARRVSGAFSIGDGKRAATIAVEPVGVARESLRTDGPRLDFALVTAPEAAVGFDVRIDPPATPVKWQIFLDDAPWPDGAVFAGPFGLPAIAATSGIATDDARAEAWGASMPIIDPSRDLGMFVTRDREREAAAAPAMSEEAAREMQRTLRQWGYAH